MPQRLSLAGDFLSHWENLASIRRCLHPEAPQSCGKIIRSHVVQCRGGLAHWRDMEKYSDCGPIQPSFSVAL